jgi:hypothetical protein
VAKAFLLPSVDKKALTETWVLVRPRLPGRAVGAGNYALHRQCVALVLTMHPASSAPPQTLSDAICLFPENTGAALAVAFT